MEDKQSPRVASDVAFLRRLGLVLLIAAGAGLLYVTGAAWLVVFAALLLAIVLYIVAEFFRKHLRMPYQLGLTVAVLLFVGLIGGTGWLMYPSVSAEVVNAIEEVPVLIERVQRSEQGRSLLSEENQEVVVQSLSGLLRPLAITVNWLVQIGTFLVLVAVLGVFFAHAPQFYREGAIRAFPPRHREEARRLLDNYGNALGLWLVGEIVAMAVVGTLTTILLLVFGTPYPLTLGLLAGLFQFVPYLGPFLWAIPATAMALGDGLSSAATVLAIYTAVQLFESNVLTPVIQHKAVSLPPVLTLMATLLLGMIFGVLGLVLGTPLAVVAMVTYNQLYLRNTLGDTDVVVPGEQRMGPRPPRLRLPRGKRRAGRG